MMLWTHGVCMLAGLLLILFLAVVVYQLGVSAGMHSCRPREPPQTQPQPQPPQRTDVPSPNYIDYIHAENV